MHHNPSAIWSHFERRRPCVLLSRARALFQHYSSYFYYTKTLILPQNSSQVVAWYINTNPGYHRCPNTMHKSPCFVAPPKFVRVVKIRPHLKHHTSNCHNRNGTHCDTMTIFATLFYKVVDAVASTITDREVQIPSSNVLLHGIIAAKTSMATTRVVHEIETGRAIIGHANSTRQILLSC